MAQTKKKSITDLDLENIKKISGEYHGADFKAKEACCTLITNYLDTYSFANHQDVYMEMLQFVARHYCNSKDTELALKYLNTALDFANRHHYEAYLDDVNSNMAIAYALGGKFLDAIDIWECLLDKTEDVRLKNKVMNNLVIAYGYTSQFTKAIDMSYLLLDLLEQGDDPEALASLYLNQGNAYNHASQNEKALDSYYKALNLLEKQNDQAAVCSVLNNISLVLGKLNRIEEAIDYSNRCLILRMVYFSDAYLAVSYSNIGFIHQQNGNHEEALLYLNRALKIYESGTDAAALAQCHIHISDSLIGLSNFQEASTHALEAEKIARDLGLHKILFLVYETLATCYSRMELYKDAFQYTQAYKEILDQRLEEITSNMISKVEADYLRHKIEDQAETYRAQNEELKKTNRIVKKKTREASKINRTLQETNNLMNRLISILSHDVRGPISNATTALRMITSGEFALIESGEMISDVSESLEETTDLLTQILLWVESKSFSANIDKMLRPVDLNPILNSILRLYNNQIKQKCLVVTVVSQADMNIVYSEPNTLKIILRNIISNAIKFTHNNGSINIAIYPKGDRLYLRFTDNGIGMTESQIQSLLKSKLSSREGTNKELGMGIGLRHCISYLKVLQAELEISSAVNQGTCFTIKLLRDKPKA